MTVGSAKRTVSERLDDMTEHTVKSYEQELHELTQLTARMGALTQQQFRDAISALINSDENLANHVISADDAVDELQQRIEQQAIHLIAKRQPVADDLRVIVGAMRISIDLERIGDFAKNIANRMAVIKDDSHPRGLMKRLEDMADLAIAQIENVLDSYAQLDAAKAIAVWNRDKEIDRMYTSLFREALTYMMEDAHSITFCTHLLFCAKNIERIGDHTTNIAEMIYFVVRGSPLKGARPKGDTSATVVAAPSG